MEVSRIRALRGPNLWCRQTVIEAIVSCNVVERYIDDVEAFENRLRVRFPDIDILRRSSQEPANSMAHALAHAALRLQTVAGCPVAFSRVVVTTEPGVYQVMVEYSEEAVGRQAFSLAEQLCMAAMQDLPFDLTDDLLRLRELNEDIRLGPSTGAIVQSALKRNIPYR